MPWTKITDCNNYEPNGILTKVSCLLPECSLCSTTPLLSKLFPRLLRGFQSLRLSGLSPGLDQGACLHTDGWVRWLLELGSQVSPVRQDVIQFADWVSLQASVWMRMDVTSWEEQSWLDEAPRQHLPSNHRMALSSRGCSLLNIRRSSSSTEEDMLNFNLQTNTDEHIRVVLVGHWHWRQGIC